jgi:hypothetical protein
MNRQIHNRQINIVRSEHGGCKRAANIQFSMRDKGCDGGCDNKNEQLMIGMRVSKSADRQRFCKLLNFDAEPYMLYLFQGKGTTFWDARP